MNGLINLNKPAGISSAAAVRRVKRLLPPGTRIGHAGTLDPFATGVLLLLIGNATKACESLMDQPKQYETTLKLGATTRTDDPESPEVTTNSEPVELSRISQMLEHFAGTVFQRPPIFSAMKVGGRRAYKLARMGKSVDLPPREVRIDAIEILDYSWPFLKLRIDCGRGTYIRSIARDLGERLQTGGYLTGLRRTRVGSFFAGNSVTLEQLAADGPAPHLISLESQGSGPAS